MLNEAQAQQWIETADEFRREVQSRLNDGVTDTGELESLVRVLGIACDVSATVSQLGYREIELELERYRIELAIDNSEDSDELEVEVESELEDAVRDADSTDAPDGEPK